jgi:hypothetical protein
MNKKSQFLLEYLHASVKIGGTALKMKSFLISQIAYVVKMINSIKKDTFNSFVRLAMIL